jgi:hypothetical protein
MTEQKTKTTKLPAFPRFVPLEAHHQADIVDAVRANGLYSDYNFISLWSWDHQKKLQLCLLNNNLVIRFQDYLNPDDYFYSFFGNQHADETAKTLLRHSITENKHELKLIPQFVVENLNRPEDFLVAEDRDSFDYIVAVKNTVDLAGHSNSKKRSLNKFLRDQGHHLKVEELDITKSSTADQIIALFEQWSSQSSSDEAHKDNELRAIRKLLDSQDNIKTDNLHVIGVFLGGTLSAFSINEILSDGFSMGHFKKSDRGYKGIGVALDHFTAKSLLNRGVVHLNHEQDLGIEGLRKAKMASQPVYFLKKYTLALAPRN